MKTFAGDDVGTVEEWERVRRPEILSTFLSEVYGRRPAEAERPSAVLFEPVGPDKVMMDGKAVRKLVRCVYYGPRGTGSFQFTAFIPAKGGPAPSFVLICNRDPAKNIDPERAEKSGFWPAEEIVERGYAAIAFFNGDVAPDLSRDFDKGVFEAFQKPSKRDGESWGILSAWAWGASRVMDWIATEPLLDPKHVGVVGHSRGGKAALVAGATDERFAMVCSNCSGCGGAKLNHMNLPKSEHISQILDKFASWFCGNFEKYRDREFSMPFDQHMWVALVAPRLLAVASATEDNWAGQDGEFKTTLLASQVWALYGKRGLVAADGYLSYHIRPGKHDLTPYDWHKYMDFADAHNWRK